MFTGIISAIGRVEDCAGGRLAVASPAIGERLAIGGSIAVNGACLTVVEFDAALFRADVVPETLRRTNLGALDRGAAVNLELPVTLAQPLDGHLVQGHVDATAEVAAVVETGSGREVSIRVPDALAPYIAEKGSIAVDGASLTVTGLDAAGGTFSVALIPHTLAATVAGGYRVGSVVNLEVDMLARYLERLVRAGADRGIK